MYVICSREGIVDVHDNGWVGDVVLVGAQTNCDLNQTDRWGYSPVLGALHNGHHEVVELTKTLQQETFSC